MPKLSRTLYIKKQIIVISLATNIMFGTNYMFVESQNDLKLHEHVIQNPYILMRKLLPKLVHLSTLIPNNYLPILTIWFYAQHSFTP